MSRRIAREIAMKQAFAELLGGGGSYRELLELSGIEAQDGPETPAAEADRSYAVSVARGVHDKCRVLDHYIGLCAKGWTVERMPAVDLCILRVAAYEMIYGDDSVSDSVAINEAVVLAKEFGGERSPAFINGVLGTLARSKAEGKVYPDIDQYTPYDDAIAGQKKPAEDAPAEDAAGGS